MKSRIDILATVGPVSDNLDTLTKIFQAGATGVRVALSYGNHEIWFRRANLIREAAKIAGENCTAIADVGGGKIRLGSLGDFNHLDVKVGEKLRLVPFSENFDFDQKKIPVNSEKFAHQISEGDKIIIGDGAVILDVLNREGKTILCEVERGGVINPNRGLIVQSEKFQPECLTQKDVEDLKYVISTDHFDAIALSFVSDPNDVEKVHEIVDKSSKKKKIISKIETQRGIENLKSIIEVSDSVVIGRGDLALYMPWYKLGNIVDKAVKIAKDSGKPWIIGTQVAEGLERFAFPTRAEICDLSRWVKEGASAILLSYETAFGARPVDAVSCVRQIIDESLKEN